MRWGDGDMTAPDSVGQIVTAAGTVDVLHRLSLAVVPVDAVTRRRCAGVRVGRETPWRRQPAARRSRALDRTGTRGITAPLGAPGREGLLLHRDSALPTRMTIRIDDPAGRWVPRRFEVSPWHLPELATDPTPQEPAGRPFLPVASRVLRPWLLPAAAHPAVPRSTGLRFRVVRGGVPVRWPRVEAFEPFEDGDARGLVAWAHGDRYGQVVLVVDRLATPPGEGNPPRELVLVVHGPDPSRPLPEDPGDPLGDLPVETATPPDSPPPQRFLPTPPTFTDRVLRGLELPAGYVTAAEEPVRELTVGEFRTVADLPFSP